ncbi:hypothetical protein [Xanthomonas phage SB4]|uniref:Uncharacterized protein n=1 Tax=Xanthomonas phage SB4 TaxID=3117473 RepID=A0ABZ2GVM0_9CAUD
MFGLMRHIAEAIVNAQVQEKKLRQDAADEIKKLRSALEYNMRTVNEQSHEIGRLRNEVATAWDKVPLDIRWCHGVSTGRWYGCDLPSNIPKCCDKLAYTERCSSCLVAAMCNPGPNPDKKQRYIVDTSLSTQWLYVYEDKKQRGHHIARFQYGAAGYAMACQYVDFLNSLE